MDDHNREYLVHNSAINFESVRLKRKIIFLILPSQHGWYPIFQFSSFCHRGDFLHRKMGKNSVYPCASVRHLLAHPHFGYVVALDNQPVRQIQPKCISKIVNSFIVSKKLSNLTFISHSMMVTAFPGLVSRTHNS